MFILLHWYCHRGFGCGKMITFTLKIFNIFGDVYTRDGTISLCQRDASAQIVVSHNYPTQVWGSILFTPSVVTKWHDRHIYMSIHHVPYLMSLSSPRHCSTTLMWISMKTDRNMYLFWNKYWLRIDFFLLSIPKPTSLILQHGSNVDSLFAHWHLGNLNEVLDKYFLCICDWWLKYFMWNCPQANVTGPYWW